ncbi:MAG TPA: SpvB/TcaC N-terminal domain-containing protein [Streptosporangiaceae bacterium]|nr:SpvB/TcaC N-terminal domain-containing protein [Streptosporangiaceae bacterium]
MRSHVIYRGFGRTLAVGRARRRSISVFAVLAMLGALVTADLRSASVPLDADQTVATCAFGTGSADSAAQATQVSQRRPAAAAAAGGPAAFQAMVDPQAAAATGGVTTLAYEDAKLAIGADATPDPIEIGITPLSETELPPLDTGMTNVTQGPRHGYRFTPHPFRFQQKIELTLPYDPALVADGLTAQDVHTYYYDEQAGCWRALERVTVDETTHTVVSLTDHFTDMVNATVTVPDHPDGASFDPNQLKGIQAAQPAAGVNLIEAPSPNNMGEARLSYPIEVPPGRGGLQPGLSIGYTSGTANGWLGLGWNLSVPAITIDTRWGVPRYDAAAETETYLLNGEQLTPVAHRGPLQPRTAEKVFHTRVEGGFARIVRHGNAPTNYTWEVTDKAGTRWLYGAGSGANGPANDATLTDEAGHVFLWALREVRDRNGNVMRYRGVRQDDFGVAQGGSVPGRALYPQRISYTGRDDAEGKYTVTFIRDRELGEPRRKDVLIDARGGFKQVTADLLRRVDVKFGDRLVRRYELGYRAGAFDKTLLASIAQFDANGALFNTHRFDYHDDIRDADGGYQAFGRIGWTAPDDNVANDTVNGASRGSGEAGALNGNTSTGAGGHLYVGFGPSRSKSGSVGVKTGFGSGTDEGLLALTDVDGDSLPDKVFTTGGTVTYRKNLSRPGGQPRFSQDATRLPTLPGIMTERTESRTVGVEGFAGGVAAQLDNIDTFATTERYFTDVNGDGITDLVNGRGVLFGRVGADGVPVYGVSADTPVPIGPGQIDASGLLPDLAAERERRIESFPLVDSVRRWVAPFDGTVRVTGQVRLAEPAGDRPAFAKPDGVRVAVQKEDTELWAETIGADDHAEHSPGQVDAIPVERGQRIYFRVQSRFDGSADQVSWDPQIGYVGVPDVTDVNGLSPYRYGAAADFTLAGRTSELIVPADGTLHLGGTLTKRAATTDDIAVTITQDGREVFTGELRAAATGQIPIARDIPVAKGQKLRWRVRVDSPIDLTRLDWTPTANYTDTPAQKINPPYEIDIYPVSDLTAPQEAYTVPAAVPAGGTLTVEPSLAFRDGATPPDGRVVLTVKRPGELVAKKVIEVKDGRAPAPEDLRFTAAANAGDTLYFDFSTTDRALAAAVETSSVRVSADGSGGAFEPAPSALHRPAEEGVFPQPYRGWAAVGYNGNRDRADRPIGQADLAVTGDFADQLPTDVDPVRDRDAFAADPKVTPPKVIMFSPSPADRRWASGDSLWVAKDTVSSSRWGGPTLGLPEASDLGGTTAGAGGTGATATEPAGVPRLARSTQVSLTGSAGGGVISVGGSIASGDSTGELDYMDMNGDKFPDVVGSGGIQYTDMDGGLGATRGSLPGGSVRKSRNEAGNASAGSAARTAATGRGQAAPPGQGTANTAESGNDMPPLGIGGNLGSGDSDTEFDLLDINGDELPDRVFENGDVALNLGYRFAAAELWPGGVLNDGSTSNRGLNLGFNTDFYGLAGGVSFNEGNSSTANTLLDVNGDGLADRIFDGDPIRVAVNTGGGFAAPVPFHGSLSGINADANAKVDGGAYVTIPVCFAVVTACAIINPGANTFTGASRAEQALRDIDGDGFADHLRSTDDGELTVAGNRTGRTNLLKTVRRPLGAKIDLDYTRDGNTYDQPQSRWVLSRVAVDDGMSGDGQNVQLSTYRYSGGVQDRLEREFRGYGRVVEEHRDPQGGDKPFRGVTRDYRTDSHYTRGLLTSEVTTDADGHRFGESVNAYQLRDVSTGQTPANAASTTATIFPQLVRTDKRFYEGEPQPGKSTRTEMSYDEFGNIVRSFDAGDPGSADDVETRTSYTADDPACRTTGVVGTARAIQVRGDGRLMRDRSSTVDCATGNVTQVRAKLPDGATAVSDIDYFADGNVKSVTGPPNAKGQRFRQEYAYDSTVATHVISIADSYGLRSAATYDLAFGLVATTTDFNGQVMRYSYDSFGRVDSITGPYETAEQRPTIDFEYHPDADVPYAVTRNIDRQADGKVRPDTIDTITFVDGLKRVIQTKKDATLSAGPDTPPQEAMTVSGRQVFDFLGRVVEQYYPTSEPKGPANEVFNPAFDQVKPTRNSYDTQDRITRAVLADDTVVTTAYGFGPDRNSATQFETAVTDAKGNTKFSYSNVRQLTTAVHESNPAGDQPSIWTSYDYDPLGEVLRVIDANGDVTRAVYDNFGRRTVVDNPDTGRTETIFDLADNPVKKITANLNARDEAVEYDYDFKRLAKIHYPVFTRNDVSYTYGRPGADHGGAGRVVRVDDAAGKVERRYGPLGEVVEETRHVPGNGILDKTFTTKYRYDTWNRVLQLTFPDGEVLSYGYDSGGMVTSAAGVKGRFGYPYLKRMDYDKFGQRVLMEAGNGVITRYSYGDADRRLAAQQAALPADQSGGYAFQKVSYRYDPVGNITSITNDAALPSRGGPKLGGPSTQTFGYDDLNRLTSAAGEFRTGEDKADRYRLDMSYDFIGNVAAKDQRHELVLGGGNVRVDKDTTYDLQYRYSDEKPHAPTAIGPDTMRYDANGNLIERDATPDDHRRQLIWDEENRLACVQDTGKNQDMSQDPSSCDKFSKPPAAGYVYDDQGNRIIKDANQTHIYPNQNFTERDRTDFKHVFVGSTRLVTKIAKSGNNFEKDQFFYQSDHLGSTTFGTDADGALAEHNEYFPTGETWVDEHPDTKNPYLFTGKELDEETGLYYYGARYYDARTSLWQSPDPALAGYLTGEGNGGVYKPGNLALYSYAEHNPVRVVDPDGRQNLFFDRARYAPVTRKEFEGMLDDRGLLRNLPSGINRNQAIGLLFEDVAIRSLGATISTPLASFSRNTQTFASPARASRTFGAVQGVRPDAIADLVVERNGMPTEFYLSSHYFEMKATDRTIGLDYSRYQPLGYLDIASRSMAGNSGRMPAFLTFVTPSDASLALGISERAATTNVAIWHSKLYRDVWAAPGEGLLVGPPDPMNGPAWSLTGDPSLRVQQLVGQPVSIGGARLPNPIPFDHPDFDEDIPW